VIYSVKGGREPDRKMAILKIDFTLCSYGSMNVIKYRWEAGVKWEERICDSPNAKEHGL
jgi:hypothetical protein